MHCPNRHWFKWSWSVLDFVCDCTANGRNGCGNGTVLLAKRAQQTNLMWQFPISNRCICNRMPCKLFVSWSPDSIHFFSYNNYDACTVRHWTCFVLPCSDTWVSFFSGTFARPLNKKKKKTITTHIKPENTNTTIKEDNVNMNRNENSNLLFIDFSILSVRQRRHTIPTKCGHEYERPCWRRRRRRQPAATTTTTMMMTFISSMEHGQSGCAPCVLSSFLDLIFFCLCIGFAVVGAKHFFFCLVCYT